MMSSLQCMLNTREAFLTGSLLVNKGCLGPSRANVMSLKLKRNQHCATSIKSEMKDNAFYIRRCVELARKAIGHTSPNPMVGCVIVKNGEIVGEGFHPKAGQPHAEVFALRDAGALAENATAYVSLEPCNHYGRTPPCTEALIRAKVKQVVVGMVDPNPIVASKGFEKLRQSGIDVVVGVEEKLCRKLNEAYIHKMVTGKPFVALRYSMSFNGRQLNQLGNGAREVGGYYSQLLQEYDGVIICSDFLTQERILPFSQETGANQPILIIIVKGSISSLHFSSVTREFTGKIIVLADNHIKLEPEKEDIEIVVLEQVSLGSILDFCGTRGLCSVLLDYRFDTGLFGKLVEDGLKENLVQKVMMEVPPVWIAGENLCLEIGCMSLRLKNLESRISNESVLVEGYLSSSP